MARQTSFVFSTRTLGGRDSAVINMGASGLASFYFSERIRWVVSPASRSIDFLTGLRSTEHELDTQVGMPNLGNNQS